MTLTPRAAEHLRLKFQERKVKPDAVVKIGVAEGNFFRLKNGGDKRYRYTMTFDDDPKDADRYVTMESQGIGVFVEKNSVEFLRGTEVTLLEAGGKAGLVFKNPNQMNDDEESKTLVPIADPANSKKQDGPTPIEGASSPDASK